MTNLMPTLEDAKEQLVAAAKADERAESYQKQSTGNAFSAALWTAYRSGMTWQEGLRVAEEARVEARRDRLRAEVRDWAATKAKAKARASVAMAEGQLRRARREALAGGVAESEVDAIVRTACAVDDNG